MGTRATRGYGFKRRQEEPAKGFHLHGMWGATMWELGELQPKDRRRMGSEGRFLYRSSMGVGRPELC